MLSKRLGARAFSLADEVREEAGKLGLEPTVENLRRTANEFREKLGPGVWAQRVVEKMRASGLEWVVADSIRSPAEVTVFKDFFGKNFFLTAVKAPFALRFSRFKRTPRGGEFASIKEFRAAEEKQLAGGEKSQAIAKAVEEADFVIENNGTVKELEEKVKALASRLKSAGNPVFS